MLKCGECEREFQDYSSLGSHIGQSHRNLTTKGYYDKYLKKNQNEGICVVCGKRTKFVYLTFGYNKCCSRKCSTKIKDFKQIMTKEDYNCPYCKETFKTITEFASHVSHLDEFHIQQKVKQERIKKLNKKIVCKICEKRYEKLNNLGIHIVQFHGNGNQKEKQKYYDNFLRTNENEGICKTCGKETNFVNLSYGYYKHCSTKCTMLDPIVQLKSKQTCLKNHGVTNYAKSKKWLDQMSNGGQAARMLTFIQNPSKPQKEIFNIIKEEYDDAIINFPILNYCADIAIPSIKVIIEYNGEYWHRGKEDYDLQRKENIEKIGWKVLIYQGLKNFDLLPSEEQIKNDIRNLKKSDIIINDEHILKAILHENKEN